LQLIDLQKRLTDALDMSVVFEEPNGSLLNVIGQRGGVCEACTKYIDREDTGREKCIRSDSEAAWRAQGKAPGKNGIRVEFYKCNGRFRNFVIPITIGDEVLGNVFSGQFLVQTPRRTDKDYDENLKILADLGSSSAAALDYARMPTEGELSQIALENNIPTDESAAFFEAYRKMYPRAKTVKQVVNAVNLLHEVAKTMSTLGNLYYYNNLYARLLGLLPSRIRLSAASKIEEIGECINAISEQTKKIPPGQNYKESIAKANQLIYDLLVSARAFETEYVGDMLSSDSIDCYARESERSEFQKRFMCEEVLFEKRSLKAVLGPLRRDAALNPGAFTTEEIDFLSSVEKILEEADSLFPQDPPLLTGNVTYEELVAIRDRMRKSREDPIMQAMTSVSRRPGLDEIEALLETLQHPYYGLQVVREDLCNKKVLEDLPEPLKSLRRSLRLNYSTTYFNWGGISSSLDSVALAREEYSLGMDENGPISLYSEELLEGLHEPHTVLQQVRTAVSTFLNCQPDEVVLTHGTAQGIQLALSSIDWTKRPARIMLSDHEHDTVNAHCEYLRKMFNAIVDHFPLNGTLSVDQVAEQIASKSRDGATKVVILSQVTYNTGQVLDVGAIVRAVRRRLPGRAPMFLIDGAQAVGQVPVDVHAIGAEFYAADGHKWLMGPIGSGFLYIEKSHLEKNRDQFAFIESYAVVEKFRAKHEPSTMNVEVYVGLRNALDSILEAEKALENDGSSSIFERIRRLSGQFRDLLKEELAPFGAIVSSGGPTSGIVTLQFRGGGNWELYDGLRRELDSRFHVKCRALRNPASIRFCISYVNSQQELRLAVHALASVMSEKFPEKKVELDQKQSELDRSRITSRQIVQTRANEARDVLQKALKESHARFPFEIPRADAIYDEKVGKLVELEKRTLATVERAPSLEQMTEIISNFETEIAKLLP